MVSVTFNEFENEVFTVIQILSNLVLCMCLMPGLLKCYIYTHIKVFSSLFTCCFWPLGWQRERGEGGLPR